MAEFMSYMDEHLWLWPVFIILSRVVDVSLGTVRTIFVVRGHRFTAAVLGFFEVLVWVVTVSGVLVNINTIKLLSYAIGFALGNAVGIVIEQKIGVGTQLVMIISRRMPHSVAFALRMAGYIVTEVPARGGRTRVALCLVVTKRRQVPRVVELVNGADVSAQVAVHDVRATTLGVPDTPHVFTGWRAILKKK